MAVLYIGNDRSKWPILDEFFKSPKLNEPWKPVTVWLASNVTQAGNYLTYPTYDIKIVFMGYYLDNHDKKGNPLVEDTISSGLITDFVQAGFGLGGKPLIACTPNRNKELLREGCSHEVNLTPEGIKVLLAKIREEERAKYQEYRMLQCVG